MKGDVMFSFLLANLDAEGLCAGADDRPAQRNAKATTGLGRWARCGLAAAAAMLAANVHAETCSQLAALGLTDAGLKSALRAVVPASGTPNGGLGFPMWLTLVDGSGIVCSVTNSLDGSANNADATADIWLGSRVISAQKANAANAFSNGRLALSTANLYSAVQPGGSLYGLQASNPVDATVAYDGKAADFGTPKDPLVGSRVGGINVFGGGLALYNDGRKLGAIGVSGDTSCTDHVVAWKVRAATSFGGVPVFGSFDKMFQDITDNPNGGTGISASGFGHPKCLNNPTQAQAGGSIVGN
jgi:uncharacterized protein GlcG (DUF336 family)